VSTIVYQCAALTGPGSLRFLLCVRFNSGLTNSTILFPASSILVYHTHRVSLVHTPAQIPTAFDMDVPHLLCFLPCVRVPMRNSPQFHSNTPTLEYIDSIGPGPHQSRPFSTGRSSSSYCSTRVKSVAIHFPQTSLHNDANRLYQQFFSPQSIFNCDLRPAFFCNIPSYLVHANNSFDPELTLSV
jgi:hypothetical protein